MTDKSDKTRNYWWVQPLLTCVIVGVGFAASYGVGRERLKTVGEKIDALQLKGSDPLADLKTRVSVLEDRLDRYISRNDEDHREIKSKLDQLIKIELDKVKPASVVCVENLPYVTEVIP